MALPLFLLKYDYKILKKNLKTSLLTIGYLLSKNPLILLFQNFNRVITRDILIDRIWDITGKIVNDNTLSVYIKRIREKLNNDSIIKTIKGIGYRVDK